MKLLIAMLCVLSAVGCSTVDPINALSARLMSSAYGMWTNGPFPIIDLPESASVQEVLDKGVTMWGFDEGGITTYKVITTRKVRLEVGDMPEYTATLIDSNLGQKIFLMRYNGPKVGWWTRFYDANE